MGAQGWWQRRRGARRRRASGGCLGAVGRGRAWYAARSRGEGRTPDEPRMPEWSNPPGVIPWHPAGAGGPRGELKHPSTPRNRQDSPSSGERTGSSPNRSRLSGQRAYAGAGVERPTRWTSRCVVPPERAKTREQPSGLERPATEGESPVGDARGAPGGCGVVSTTRAVEPRGKLGRPRPKAKYRRRPIVNEYREGKVKSTPGGG